MQKALGAHGLLVQPRAHVRGAFTASWELVGMFLEKAAKAALPSEALAFKIDAALVVLMAGLALVALADMLYAWYGFFTKPEPASARGLGDA